MPINYGLAGKVAAITGANAGIGRAIAVAMAKAELKLSLADVHISNISEINGELGIKPAPVAGIFDVSNGEQVKRFAEETQARFGAPDILVCNAGIFPRRPFLEMSEEEWDRVIAVNLKGTFLCARHFAPGMVARGQGGRIIVMSSSAGFEGVARGAHYSASKAGLVGLVKALALELAPHQITVNAVAPGITDTAQPRYGLSEAQIVERAKTIPLGRIGQPEDVVNAVLWLASAAASYVTGQTLHVNGGALRF